MYNLYYTALSGKAAPKRRAQTPKEREPLIRTKKIWRSWDLNWFFLFSSTVAPLLEPQLAITCYRSFAAVPQKKESVIFPFPPIFCFSLWQISLIMILAWHVKSFPPHTSFPSAPPTPTLQPCTIPPREQSHTHKSGNSTPLFFFYFSFLAQLWGSERRRKKRGAGAHLRQGPTAAGKAEGKSSSVHSQNQEQQVVTPEIPPPLSHSILHASLLGFVRLLWTY